MNENTYLEQKNETMGENSFMKKLLKKRLNQKGLTLIELLAVIVILAIVAAIAVPAIGNIINNSRDEGKLADASNILSGLKLAETAGACKSAATYATTTCLSTNTAVGEYVDGVPSGATYGGTKDSSGNWTVFYSGLTGFNTVPTGLDATTTPPSITETNLNTALRN